MATSRRLRDAFESWCPVWLRDRPGFVVGYRILWAAVALLDALLDVASQGRNAAWPGVGTSSALPLIGRSRGIIRGQSDTDAGYAIKLRRWLDVWRDAGSQETLGRQIHEYLGNSPMVRVINRAGHWVTINADGTVVTHDVTFDWDSVSHPARAGFWSEVFIVVYPTQWAPTGGTWGDGTTYGGSDGLTHGVTRVEVDAVKGIVAQWKAAHTKVRAIIWTSDAALFDPTDALSLPDGEWGGWGTTGSGSRVPSNRDLTVCHYWEL